MQKCINLFILGSLLALGTRAQELYVFSEPASNMPAHSLSAKLGSRFADLENSKVFRQRYLPELMLGLNRNWMVHLSTSFSDFYTSQMRWESLKTYAKYRFYSNDEVHRHFRMAAFAEAAYSRSPFHYGDINLDGDNSGVQAGIIATQLVNKLAVSGTASFIRAFGSPAMHGQQMEQSLNALSYSLSAGYLLFPYSYDNYQQTNVNLYLEAIGMQGLDKGGYMMDLAPALQFIFNSNFKVNLGARLQAFGNMERISNRNYFISLERTFLGALKKRKKDG